MSLAVLGLVLCLLLPAAGQARTYYAANNCSGQPTPCTTNLQTALDATTYDTISLVGSSTFTGNYLVDRSLTVDGNGTATIAASSVWALRIEGSSTVVVTDVAIDGTLGISGSSTVSITDVDIVGEDAGVIIDDCDGVDLLWITVEADRGIESIDSRNVELLAGVVDAVDYAVVQADGDFYASYAYLDGGVNAVVIQTGGISGYPDFEAGDSTLTNGTSSDHVWTWNLATRSYTSSGTVDEDVTTNSTLVTLIGYSPWPGL